MLRDCISVMIYAEKRWIATMSAKKDAYIAVYVSKSL